MLSHLYVMASVDWDRNHDLPQREVDLIGCASITKLMPGVETTEVLRKGSCIPHTHTHLQADNYGIRFSDLETDWDKVVRYILNHQPPDLSLYPNPYTGQPLPEKTVQINKPTFHPRTGNLPSAPVKKSWWKQFISWIRTRLGS